MAVITLLIKRNVKRTRNIKNMQTESKLVKWLFIIVVSLSILLTVLFMRRCGDKNQISITEANVNKLKVERDSILKVTEVKMSKDSLLEKSYLKQIDSLKEKNKEAQKKLAALYNQKDNNIKQLPLDSQISYYMSQVFKDGDYPKKEVTEGDTTIKITPEQLTYTNLKFNHLNYLYDLKDTLQEQLDSCYEIIDNSKLVLRSKNTIIANLYAIQDTDTGIISGLNNMLLEQRKTSRKRIIGGTLIGIGVGILVKTILIK